MTGTSIHVRATGICLLQDEGRYGYQTYGVPAAGAWDMLTYNMLNLLLNSTGKTGLPMFELITGTIALRSTNETIHAAVSGVDVEVLVDGARQAKDTIFSIYPHSVLTVKNTSMLPAYVAVAGLQVKETTLGSVSFDSFSLLHTQPDLREGTTFIVSDVDCEVGTFLKPQGSVSQRLRYLPSGLTETDTVWSVESNTRSGIRFAPVTGNIVSGMKPSNPVTVGTIQITPEGSPIILGVDAGTVGGYEVLGTVITADLHKLPYMNEAVRMLPVTIEEAHAAYEQQTKSLRSSVFPIKHLLGDMTPYSEH